MGVSPFVLVLAGLVAIVASAYVGWGELVGSLTLAMVGVSLVVVGLAAVNWKGARNGKVG